MQSDTRLKTSLGLNGFGWAHVIADLPYDFEAILKHATKLGFDGIELFGMPDEYPTIGEDQVILRKRIDDHGLTVASIQSLPGGLGNGHPGSAYSLCRTQYNCLTAVIPVGSTSTFGNTLTQWPERKRANVCWMTIWRNESDGNLNGETKVQSCDIELAFGLGLRGVDLFGGRRCPVSAAT